MIKSRSLLSLLILALAVSLVFTLAGCGGKTETPADKPAADNAAPSGEQQVSEAGKIIEAANAYLSTDRGKKSPTVNASDIYENVVKGGDQSYFLVSLQKPEDYAKGHVKGTINIPYARLPKKKTWPSSPRIRRLYLYATPAIPPAMPPCS